MAQTTTCSKVNAVRILPARWNDRNSTKGFIEVGQLCLEFKLEQEKMPQRDPDSTSQAVCRLAQYRDSESSWSLCTEQHLPQPCCEQIHMPCYTWRKLLDPPILGHLRALACVGSSWKARGREGGFGGGWCWEGACSISRILLGEDLVAQRPNPCQM